MPFEKGESGNPEGRPVGAVGKLTKTVKETVLSVFNELQENPQTSLKAFAEENPVEFYKIAAKLIPTEISGSVEVLSISFKD